MKMKKTHFYMLVTAFMIFGIATALLVYAQVVETTLVSPADESFSLTGNVTFTGLVKTGVFFNASGFLNDTFNATNVSLWTNESGGWNRNITNSTQPALFDEGHGFFDVQFVAANNYSDGTHILWGIEVCTNSTFSIFTCNMSTVNYTLFVEYPPDNITINAPASAENIGAATFDVNISATSNFTTDTLTCKVYTNDSTENTLVLKHTAVVFVNSSLDGAESFNFTLGVNENQSIAIAVSCEETTRPAILAWAVNVTFNADRTKPVVALSLNFTNSVTGLNISRGNTVNLTYLVTELNPLEFIIYINDTTNTMIFNKSRIGISNGDIVNFSLENLSDGDYNVGGNIWDSAGNNLTIENRTFGVDTTLPVIDTVRNVSTNNLLTVQISWHTTELTNGSITYGNGSAHIQVATSSTTFVSNHSLNITLTEGLDYVFNITSCDRAGNCNGTGPNLTARDEFTINAQTPIHAGWNAYGMSAPRKAMGRLFNDSGADFVYWWNGTSQTWLSNSDGIGANANHDILGGQVYWLFKSFNSSWAKDVTVPANKYAINISSGGDFIAAQFDYTFVNLSDQFSNASTGSIATGHLLGGRYNTTTGAGGNQNVDISELEFYSFFNNSNQRYQSYFRNDTFNNLTVVPRGVGIFVGFPLNISFNGSAIFANWSIT